MTSLVLLGVRNPDTTLTTACELVTVTGGTGQAGGGVGSSATGNGWLECYLPASSANSGVATSSIPAPSGLGYIYNSSTLDNQTVTAGTWTFKLSAIMLTNTATFQTVTIRVYKYNLVSTVYTQIGTMSLTNQAIALTKTGMTFTGSFGSMGFVSNDRIYVDIWFQLTGGWGATTSFQAYRGTSSTGAIGDAELDTPAYVAAVQVAKDLKVRGNVSALGIRDLKVRANVGTPIIPVLKDLKVRANVANSLLPRVGIAVAGQSVIFEEDSWQWHQTVDERMRLQFTIIDYANAATYGQFQQILVNDPTLGRIFSGVIIDAVRDKTNTYPDPATEWQIDTSDNFYFAGKRTSNRQYTTPTYAGKIVLDTVIDALAAEGIIAPYAQSITTTQADWATGVLSSVTASNNVPDGDLELTPALSGLVSASYALVADWAGGTFTNMRSNAGGDISLIGAVRDWSSGSTSGQTMYTNASGSQSVSSGVLRIKCNAGQLQPVARSRQDYAGTWADATVAVDMLIDDDTSLHSLEYRTTLWNNTDSYAYVVELTSKTVEVRVGTNGASQITTSVQLVTFPNKLAHGWYRVLLTFVGTSHTVSVNGVQYISTTSSSFTGAGYIGLRNRNMHLSGSSQTMQFDNFAVFSALSGTWQSVSNNINAAGIVASSSISWNQSLSTGGTVLVQTSLDAGATWQNASNGGTIPGLPPGSSAVGKFLLVRVALSNATALCVMPDLKSLTWSVGGGYALSGSRVSPVLTLDPAVTLGNTLIAWNAILPSAATTLGVDTSIDGGVTWTDVTGQNGGPIPGFNNQPEPTTDNFAVDSSGNYTSFIGYGGGIASWVSDTANSRVVATNGASAVYLNNSIDTPNVDALTNMDYADAAGLVLCYNDPSNYYGVVVGDSAASIGTKNLVTLYKTVGGVQSTLATGAVSFQRGTYHSLRATVNMGLITVSLDGTSAIAYTDVSPLPAGQVGLYQAGGIAASYSLHAPFGMTLDQGMAGVTSTTARFYFLWVQPLADSAIGQTVMTRLRLATTDSTVTPQVLDLTIAAYTPNIGIGTLMPSADNRQVYINKVIDDCAKQSNYLWYIDQNKTLHFNHRSTMPAPWIIQSSSIASAVDLEVDGNLKLETANTLYRNRQVLTGVIYTAALVNNFQGDTQTTSFTLTNPVAPGNVPIITLNTAPQKVGKKGTMGAQWYYAEGDPVIAQDPSLVVLVATDRLKVTYTGTYIAPLTADNVAAQVALQPTEGGSGIVEAVEDVSQRNMFAPAALVYANQLLVRYCLAGRTFTFTTYRNGLAVGQSISAFVPEEGLFNSQMLLTTIDATLQTQPGGTVLYKYVCSVTELPASISWQRLLAAGILLTT